MEAELDIPTNYFDFVYSIYGIGWTTDLQGTFKKIASYLKKDGIFIFSWHHTLNYCVAWSCIECAKKAGYVQAELNVVADNASAISLYNKVGFVEYGRNPKGFCSRTVGWQEIVLMATIQEFASFPSSITEQAPHSPSLQPHLTPVSLNSLRSTSSRRSFAFAVETTSILFKMNLIVSFII